MIKLIIIMIIEMSSPYVLMISQNPMFHTPFSDDFRGQVLFEKHLGEPSGVLSPL